MPKVAGANVIGAFPVYSTSGNVQLFSNLMAKKQQEDDAEKKALAQQLASLKTDGLREYDKGKYYNQYDKWRTKAQEAFTTRDKQQKFNLQAEADKLYEDLNNLVYRSKTKATKDADLGVRMLEKPYMFNKEGKQMFQRSLKAEIDSPDDIQDFTKIPLGHDLSKVATMLNALDDQVMQVKSRYMSTDWVNDGKGLLTKEKVRVGDSKLQAMEYATAYDTQDDVKAFIQQTYPMLDWNNEAQAKAMAIQDLVNKRELVREEAPETHNDPEYISPAERERLDNSRATLNQAREGNNESTYRQKVIAGILNNNPLSIDEMKAYLPSGAKINYGTSKTVPGVSKGGCNFIRVDIPAIMGGENRATIIRPSITEDISLSKGDAFNRINAILSQYSGEMISPSKLNIQGGKPRGEQVKATGEAKVETTVETPKPTTPAKTRLEGTSAQLEASAKNKGMTKAQYKKVLEDAGYTVIER